jgi:hypothetical protein
MEYLTGNDAAWLRQAGGYQQLSHQHDLHDSEEYSLSASTDCCSDHIDAFTVRPHFENSRENIIDQLKLHASSYCALAVLFEIQGCAFLHSLNSHYASKNFIADNYQMSYI